MATIVNARDVLLQAAGTRYVPPPVVGVDGSTSITSGTGNTNTLGGLVDNSLAFQTALSDMASDSKLTPVEKLAIRKEWDAVIFSEKAGLNSQASTFGVTTENTAYNNAWQGFATYLNGGTAWTSGTPSWISDANLATTTVIVGSTFRSTAKAFYGSRTALLNALTSKAKSTADAAALNAAAAVAGIADKLSKSSADTLSGAVSVSASGGLKVGTITWDSAGNVTSGSGIAITAKGLVGASSGSATFSISTTGEAYYSGAVSASQITTGSITAATVDTSSYMRAYGSSPTIVNLGYHSFYPTVFGDSTRTAGVGVLGNASGGPGVLGRTTKSGDSGVVGWGLAADANGVYGQSSSSTGAGVRAVNNDNGPALVVTGKMTISNSTLVTNLNADMLDGNHASAFATTSHTHSGYATSSHTHTNYMAQMTADGGGTGYVSSNSVYFYTHTGLTAYEFFCDGGSSVGMRSVSDERLKQDIEPETLGLAFIKQLTPKRYRMKKAPSIVHHGFIAQEVAPMVPTGDSLRLEYPDGVKGLDYLSLIAPLVKAIQELTEKVERLENLNA